MLCPSIPIVSLGQVHLQIGGRLSSGKLESTLTGTEVDSDLPSVLKIFVALSDLCTGDFGFEFEHFIN